MMIIRRTILAVMMLGSLAAMAQQEQVVPLGGNSWVKQGAGSKARVTAEGWRGWNDKSAVWSSYIKLSRAGKLQLSARLSVPSGSSELSFSINDRSKTIRVSGNSVQRYEIGEWEVPAGYIEIRATGISRSGELFANVNELLISGTAVDSNTCFVKNNEGNYFYWGRRGPSVHLNYDLAGTGDIEWFYNEITVPEGNDVIGSYFMANGFGEGYFGIQVNSAKERRVIFSVWSPFKTDNPKEVPQDQKIILDKKGKDVVANEFGNEGSGGHSHLVYPWKAGQTYRFLLHGEPLEGNRTRYTAYFDDPAKPGWQLIASFTRPATRTWLRRLHSFLENFAPETGNTSRLALYHNQWVKPTGKDWLSLNRMYLTADATAARRYRMDYGGGVQNGRFYLKNGGFFNQPAELRVPFSVEKPIDPPGIDIPALIRLAKP